MIINQIVPMLPPNINGLGDYALKLAIQLQKDFSLNTHFIVGDSLWNGSTEIEGFAVTKVKRQSPQGLLSTIPLSTQGASIVILHYVGYGYAKRGCPVWLINGLKLWKKHHLNARLIVMFHETFAVDGPPWTSVFWLSPLQKMIAAELVKLCDSCITSKEAYAKTLEKLSNGLKVNIKAIPVFSNVGEPSDILLLSDRKRNMVVFGQNRLQAYTESLPILKLACETLNIEEVWDIGPQKEIPVKSINSIPIIRKGPLPADKLSDILLSSIAGFMSYDPYYLARSGIFAAYCSHGMLPINAKYTNERVDGVVCGIHYWFPQAQEAKRMEFFQTIATNSHLWYTQHNLSKHARQFFLMLSDLVGCKVS